MINHGLFTSNKEDWETPGTFFNNLDEKYHFKWDLAANDDNAKCSNYFTRDDNSLDQNWGELEGNLFINPPYGRELKLWVKKASETHLRNGQYLVMLIPSRTDTSYWHDYIFNHAEIEFLRGRLKFEVDGISGNPAPFPSALIIYKGDAELSMVPDYVAKYINRMKSSGRDIWDAMHNPFRSNNISEYMEDNSETFVRAWLNGYVAED